MSSPLVCVGFDPGIVSFAYVIVTDSSVGMPTLHGRATRRLDGDASLADQAFDAAVTALDLSLLNVAFGPDTEFICGVETFTHRRYVPRRIDSGPRMGEVVGAIRLAARTCDYPVLDVAPEAHRNSIPRAMLPKGLHNQHERDAYTTAFYAIALHKQSARAR